MWPAKSARCLGTAALVVMGFVVSPAAGRGADWEPTTGDLIRAEKDKPGEKLGFGGVCGVVVDHATGDVSIDLSDKGLYRSTDRGETWKRLRAEPLKGRTEWPGCLMFDPVGKGKKLVAALVYGGPIAVSPDAGLTWTAMHGKSSHVDWCAVDWTDPAMRFVLALKHESGDLLIVSRDGGGSFEEVGKGYGPAWIFDGSTAVAAEAKSKTRPMAGLLRTTDGAKTWKSCGNYTSRALPRWHEGKLYWVVEGALITTADKGETWTRTGEIKDGRFGPIFGKNPGHMFVLTGAGIVESADGGLTWLSPIKLPKEIGGAGPLTWMEYDPKNDVLYTMKMGSDLFRMTRGR